jgi:hypothetical protein
MNYNNLDVESEPLYKSKFTLNKRGYTIIKSIGIGCLVLLSGFTLNKFFNTSKTPEKNDFFIKLPRKCSVVECLSSNCNFQLAPFTCVKGIEGLVGACADNSQHWEDNQDVCEEQCDLRDCNLNDIVEISDEEQMPRKCDNCNEKQCSKLNENYFQACSLDNPYVCLEGSAYLACSSNKYYWATRVYTTCNECCDIHGCQ